MTLSIRNSRAEQLARQVAAETGENITQAVIPALEERLERLKGTRSLPGLFTEIMKISHRCSQLPDLDTRPEEQILGYDDDGVPAHGNRYLGNSGNPVKGEDFSLTDISRVRG